MSAKILRSTLMIGVAFLAMTIFASTSYADSGDMVRKGRFVWHKVSSDIDHTRGSTTSQAFDSRVVYDKGDLGKYVRHGRHVSRVYDDGSVPKTTMAKRADKPTRTRVVDHYKHKHYMP